MPNYIKVTDAVQERFGDKVRVFSNDPDMLTELTGDSKCRAGSFEVVDVKTKQLLYTKMGSGLHVTEKKEWVDKMLDKVAELHAEAS